MCYLVSLHADTALMVQMKALLVSTAVTSALGASALVAVRIAGMDTQSVATVSTWQTAMSMAQQQRVGRCLLCMCLATRWSCHAGSDLMHALLPRRKPSALSFRSGCIRRRGMVANETQESVWQRVSTLYRETGTADHGSGLQP